MFLKKLILLVFVMILVSCTKKSNQNEITVKIDFEAGINEIQFDFENVLRDFSVIIPDDYDASIAYPILFYFHGLGGSKLAGESILSKMTKHNSFIGISPQGHLDSWNSGLGGVPSEENDLGFVIEILSILNNNLLLNLDRIYAIGYSNGGQMCNDLALKTDRFTAIASLSSTFPEGMTMPELVNKISIFQLHGELDSVVPYNGGQSSVLSIAFQSVDETINYWVDLNNIDHTPTVNNPELDCFIYSFKDEGNPYEVRFCKLQGIAHHIGLHNYINSLQAYNDIWDFFDAHPKLSFE